MLKILFLPQQQSPQEFPMNWYPQSIQVVLWSGAAIDPFGVVRWSLDRSDVGHPGIDLTVGLGTPVYAVSDGEIVSSNVASDGRGGIKCDFTHSGRN